MAKPHATVGFRFNSGTFGLSETAYQIVNAIKECDGGQADFTTIGLALGMTGDEVAAVIIDLDRRGVLTIEWPPELKNMLN